MSCAERGLFAILSPAIGRLSFIIIRRSYLYHSSELEEPSFKFDQLFSIRYRVRWDMPTPAPEWTVAELLKRCSMRPADEVAWQEFVRRYDHTIRLSVMKTFHRKAREEADRKPQFPEDLIEDLIQAVYMRLVEDHNRALERFAGEFANSIFQYLSMISINVVRDYFREMRAQKRPKVSYSLDELLETSGDGALFEEARSRLDGRPLAHTKEAFTLEEIEEALDKAVSGKNRERDILIFKLRYNEGLTLEEITKAMGLKISAISVGSILNRIIRKLRLMLEPPRCD
jgi:RNA polymerase sigma factor (sigma-70 family)